MIPFFWGPCGVHTTHPAEVHLHILRKCALRTRTFLQHAAIFTRATRPKSFDNLSYVRIA